MFLLLRLCGIDVKMVCGIRLFKCQFDANLISQLLHVASYTSVAPCIRGDRRR
jgi:hypothetical protein